MHHLITALDYDPRTKAIDVYIEFQHAGCLYRVDKESGIIYRYTHNEWVFRSGESPAVQLVQDFLATRIPKGIIHESQPHPAATAAGRNGGGGRA